MHSNIWKVAIMLAALVVLSAYTYAQPSIEWTSSADKTGETSYSITLSGAIPDTWYVYGLNHDIEGLEAPIINFEYENVHIISGPQFKGKSRNIEDAIFENKVTSGFSGFLQLKFEVNIIGTIPPILNGSITVYAANGKEFYPVEHGFAIALDASAQIAGGETIKRSNIRIDEPLSQCGGQEATEKSLFGIFLLGFAGGLIALLTPCVFPMVPVTVSYFTMQSGNRKAAIRNGVLFGVFIFLIYILLSLPFHILGDVNPEIFNAISTNAWLNLLFFAIFTYFALSFFGFFVISLPNSLANKADGKAGLGNLGGIFFMSLTLVIVSFSCTGPILGSLLVGSLSGGAWPLTAGLAGFGVALGLPYGLFATFPNLLKSLPKSGGWLDTVKKVLAFVELALALKFLSNADLVMHWGLVKREVFIAIWIVVALGLSAYLFGILRLPHDYKGQKISVVRKVLAVVSLTFALYLVPGVLPNSAGRLQLLSGFPPPMSYSLYDNQTNDHGALEANVINDYQRAVMLSDSLSKPLLIDFTGWACVNCRKMEENIWSQPAVSSYIKENYILVSLYVDDRKKLPVLERFTYETNDRKTKSINTYGDKWATFEAENFQQVTQPLYAVVDNQERLLNIPVGYTPDAAEYLNWLQCAKETFDKAKLQASHEN
ncbi:cytochrome c biogenesis protein CcdA [Chryseolinea sp. T2]|uniref:protein-disulfide reductase DsbD family protein n=1 Tax=Chryseolinea sp. T2 TaxID=3129255 RepID=UPI0030783013